MENCLIEFAILSRYGKASQQPQVLRNNVEKTRYLFREFLTLCTSKIWLAWCRGHDDSAMESLNDKDAGLVGSGSFSQHFRAR
jgi:hypothetical protein